MKYFVIALLFYGCVHQKFDSIQAPVQIVESTDTSLHFSQGYWVRRNAVLTGLIISRYPDSSLQMTTPYVGGKEEGWKYSYYPGNILAEKRYFHQGEKDSVHYGWWPNKNKRFVYHFSKGTYNGDFTEWYERGNPYRHIHYTKGVEDWAKGWRENGKLYMNFIVKNGRKYGIENSNLCYTVKNGKGEFVKSQ